MALFHWLRKKEEKKGTSCACCCGNPAHAADNLTQDNCSEAKDGIFSIKVLGAGCKACRQQYENAMEAAAAMALPVEVEYITDMSKVMAYGAMGMPALVVNEKVVATGQVLKAADVKKLLQP